MLYSIHTFITFLYPEEYEEATAFEEDNKALLDSGDLIKHEDKLGVTYVHRLRYDMKMKKGASNGRQQ